MGTRSHRLRPRGLAAVAAGIAAVVALAFTLTSTAIAATLFSADFEDGSTSGWSKSGGTWSVGTDGSRVLAQTSSGSDLARMFAGDNGWTDYSLQARVKPTAFGSSDGLVGISARTTSSSKFYRLALLSAGRAELQAYNGSGSVTVLGSSAVSVSTSTWYTLRIDVAGSTISGFVNGTRVASGTSTLAASGRIAAQTFHAAGEFDDVAVTSSGTTPTDTPTVTVTPTSGPGDTSLVGWATQGGGTTGGAGGSTVTVTSLSELTTAAASTSATIIRVNGNFSCSEDVRVASNKTILGVGAGSGLNGCGFNLRDISNVILRNLRISNVQAGNGNGDAVHIDNATRLWIDHNDLSSDTTHGTDYYDGLVDASHGADYITVSWNVFHDHIKCSLVGHSDSNASEDTGHLRLTYHHNVFRNCYQRNPRVRFGNPVHVYNNYYVTTGTPDYSYAIASTENAGVLVEANYFEGISDPTHLGEGSSDPGSIVARNNVLVGSGTILTSGSVASIPYSYTLTDPNAVKSVVTAGAGTGKITT